LQLYIQSEQNFLNDLQQISGYNFRMAFYPAIYYPG
jgi:hypothetical protein